MLSILLSDIIYSNINHHDESILNPLSIPIVFPSFGQGLFIIFILSILRKRPFVGCFQKTTGAFRIHRTAGRHPWRPLGNGMGIPGLGTPPDWGRDEKSSLNWCKFAGWHVSTWFHLIPLVSTWFHLIILDTVIHMIQPKRSLHLIVNKGCSKHRYVWGVNWVCKMTEKKSCSYNMLQLIYNRLEQPWFNVRPAAWKRWSSGSCNPNYNDLRWDLRGYTVVGRILLLCTIVAWLVPNTVYNSYDRVHMCNYNSYVAISCYIHVATREL